MPEGNSIVNLGEISKPATVLIEKISEAVGGYFRPYQIKRIANAEAEAEIVRAQTQIEVTELHQRAIHRFIAEEAKKQENIETITEKAIPHLKESSKPQEMDDDWITNFFDKCRIISDEEMQSLWSKVLAGEANAPGSFSKRTVNCLGSIDKADARLFIMLCSFGWIFNESLLPLVYDVEKSIYTDASINFAALTHLDDIGLVSFSSLSGFRMRGYNKSIMLYYYEQPIIVEFKNEDGNDIYTGKIMLTQTGQELARICGSKPADGFLEYILDLWMKDGLVVSCPYPRDRYELQTNQCM